MALKQYCEKFPREGDKSLVKLHELMEKEMEQVKKGYYLTFYKHLPICDRTFRPNFLHEIQAHYDNFPKP
jgi:hypothetical protein